MSAGEFSFERIHCPLWHAPPASSPVFYLTPRCLIVERFEHGAASAIPRKFVRRLRQSVQSEVKTIQGYTIAGERLNVFERRDCTAMRTIHGAKL